MLQLATKMSRVYEVTDINLENPAPI